MRGLNSKPSYGIFGMLQTRHYSGRAKADSRYAGLHISIALDVCGKDSLNHNYRINKTESINPPTAQICLHSPLLSPSLHNCLSTP